MFRRRHSQSFVSHSQRCLAERGFRRLFAYLLQRIARMPEARCRSPLVLPAASRYHSRPSLAFIFCLEHFWPICCVETFSRRRSERSLATWTFPLIISADFSIGSWALEQLGMVPPSVDLSVSEIIADPMNNLMPLLMPMMLGGLIMGVVTWFASFGMAYCALIWWREHRARRLASRSRRYYQMPETSGERTGLAGNRMYPMSSSVPIMMLDIRRVEGMKMNNSDKQISHSGESVTQALRLGVNIDRVATVRNACGGASQSSPCRLMAEQAGADGITAHLREDRRHIRDADMAAIKAAIGIPLNFEMAATAEMVALAVDTMPNAACIVPERREEVTTEGGLAVAGHERRLADLLAPIKGWDPLSLFIEASEVEIRAAAAIGADIIELYTGRYCHDEEGRGDELARLANAAKLAHGLGLECHAGHGLDYDRLALSRRSRKWSS